MLSQQMQQPSMYQQQPHQQTRPSPLEQQKMMYQMQIQQQLQQRNMMTAQRMQGVPQNPSSMAKPQMQAANGQYPQGMRPQQPIPRQNNPEQFMKQLTTFMQSRGLALDPNPIAGDRQINLLMLYMAVTKFGGYRRVNQGDSWAQVAQMLHFNLIQNPTAPQQIKGHYERNLMMFEEAYNAQQQRQKAMMQQSTGVNMGTPHPQMSPTKQMRATTAVTTIYAASSARAFDTAATCTPITAPAKHAR
jgi:SWI/SNF chromatin-remodeling complex subunit SWI1